MVHYHTWSKFDPWEGGGCRKKNDHKGKVPLHLSVILFCVFRSMEDIWKDVHHAIQYTAIVFEETKSDLGMQVYFWVYLHICVLFLLCNFFSLVTRNVTVLVESRSYYRPQRSWAKVMFLQASVILSTGGKGVCLSACWDARPPPQEQTLTPPDQAHPPRDQEPPPPDQAHHHHQPPRPGTPPLDQAHPPHQAPPPEADASIRSMSGRYASYWNAFLCWFIFWFFPTR